MKQVVYSIEGNIGSGKTVLLNLLSKHLPNLVIAPEPVEDWQHINRFNLLQQYYDDPHRWAYTFQNYAILTRSKHLHKLLQTKYPKGTILFSERSIGADKEIFAKLLYHQGKMTEMEFNLYLKFYSDLESLYKLPVVHRHIYLRVAPQRCLQRIKRRGRFEQKTIDISYLDSLHDMHEHWLTGNGSLILEGTQEFEKDQKQLMRMVDATKVWLGKAERDLN